jgi:hypothetical protein
MQQLALFPDMVTTAETEEQETAPERIIIPHKRVKRIIGDNFIVVKCLSCDQMIMVDPEYYELDQYHDKVCEDCNDKYHDKYQKFLKLKL